MNKEEAIAVAQKISLDEGCVQHVNINIKSTFDITYYVSDWYNCDSTVASFENGNEL